jgi:hypothetical protein
MVERVEGTSRIEISKASEGQLRVRLTIGEVANAPTHWNEPEPEGVEISVLVQSPDNPPLLSVHVAALERAREMIDEQIAKLRKPTG